jgi:hypothetical protein
MSITLPLGVKKAHLLLLIFLLCFLSCSDDVERTRGLVNVFLIGSAGEFDDVVLEVLGVEIKTTGSRGTDNTEFIFLPNIQADKRVSVGALTGNGQFLIGRSELSENPISEIRLRLGDDNFVISGSQRFPLQFSSESAANPTLLVNFSVFGGISHDIFLDFDAFRSFDISGGLEPRIDLNPIIRPFMSLERGQANGSISPPGQRVGIFVFDENEELLTSTGTQAQNGSFSIRGLEENKLYKLLIIPFNESYLRDTLDSVRVNIREVTQLETVNLRLKEE